MKHIKKIKINGKEYGVGGVLPSVTEADNGKVLMVVNGAWCAVTMAESEVVLDIVPGTSWSTDQYYHYKAENVVVNTDLHTNKPSGEKITAISTMSSLKTDFYVAQDNDYIYVFVQLRGQWAANSEVLTHLRLGFNADDYTQQIDLYSPSKFYSTTQQVGSVTIPAYQYYPFIVSGYADAKTFTRATADPLMNYATDSKSINDKGVIFFEFKMSKVAVTEAYAKQFDAEASFDSMYIGLSARYNGVCWMTGTVAAEGDASTTWIPDKVVFDA